MPDTYLSIEFQNQSLTIDNFFLHLRINSLSIYFCITVEILVQLKTSPMNLLALAEEVKHHITLFISIP